MKQFIRTKRGKLTLSLVVILAVLFVFSLPSPLFTTPYSTVVSDREGLLLGARIANDGQWRFPLETEVPEKLEKALLTFEDEYFYYHFGINPFSIAKAFAQNIKAKRIVRGASTLTMQTIRMARNKPRTLWEKCIEAVLAVRLECSYSKKEILALYASHAPFGGNVVGCAAASWRYFGHTSSTLSWAEAATLAVLPNAPSAIHISKERATLLRKRNLLLKKLFDKKSIDRETYELAIEEALPDEPLPLPQFAPHLVSNPSISSEGEFTLTSINLQLQSRVELLVDQWNHRFQQQGIRDIAAIVVDVECGEVLAYHGNSGFYSKREGSQVDIIQSPRSTGSILKPFLYASMLDKGELLPSQLLPDIPLNINGFTPQNFNLSYDGAVPAKEALSRSLNIPFVYLLRKHGISRFYSTLSKLGFTTINQTPSYYGLSLILGGAEAKLVEVVAAYLQLGQAALSLEYSGLNYSVDARKRGAKLEISPGAAWLTLDALKEVNRPGEVAWKQLPSMQTIAWKTGTSHGFRDGWAVGLTSKYLVGVWVGNATGEGNADLVGGRSAGPVLFDLFNLLPKSPWFTPPKLSFIDSEICTHSGFLKGPYCNETDTLHSLAQGLETETCPYHYKVNLSPDEKYRIYKSCLSEESSIEKSWFVLPPVWEWYYKRVHPEYRLLPPFKQGCGEDYLQPMQFVYPQMHAHLIVTKQLDGSPGVITFELVHTDPNARTFWHMDDYYLGETSTIHKMTLSPSDGRHILTVVDSQGNSLSLRFTSESSK